MLILFFSFGGKIAVRHSLIWAWVINGAIAYTLNIVFFIKKMNFKNLLSSNHSGNFPKRLFQKTHRQFPP